MEVLVSPVNSYNDDISTTYSCTAVCTENTVDFCVIDFM